MTKYDKWYEDKITGRKYGKITVISEGRNLCRCRCTCGKTFTARRYGVLSGRVRGCTDCVPLDRQYGQYIRPTGNEEDDPYKRLALAIVLSEMEDYDRAIVDDILVGSLATKSTREFHKRTLESDYYALLSNDKAKVWAEMLEKLITESMQYEY